MVSKVCNRPSRVYLSLLSSTKLRYPCILQVLYVALILCMYTYVLLLSPAVVLPMHLCILLDADDEFSPLSMILYLEFW